MQTAWLPVCLAMTTGVLQAIPDDLYEAATMDGASAFTRLRTITLPLVLYAIAPIIITQYTFNFNNFNIIYLFNNGGPAVAGSNAGGTDILVSWIYKLTMSSSQYAIAATITILLSIFVVGLALWQFRATKSFKMTTWRKGSNMAQSPSIKREKWIRLSPLVVIPVSVVIIYPLVWTVGASLNAGNSLLSTSIIPENLSFQHYADLFNGNVNYTHGTGTR